MDEMVCNSKSNELKTKKSKKMPPWLQKNLKKIRKKIPAPNKNRQKIPKMKLYQEKI